MIRELIETGKTVDAAIESACEKLGINRDDCQWEIIDLPKKTFLGLKLIPAKVRVSVEVPDPAPVKKAEPAKAPPAPKKREPAKQQPTAQKKPPVAKEARANDKAEKPAATGGPAVNSAKLELAKDYISSILVEMGLNAELVIRQEESGSCIDIQGKGLGMIIGRRGETLDAIQYLTSLVANRLEGDYMRITIDCGDYRTKRQETLQELAKKLSAQVLKTNTSKTLEPMNPFERRIIHATVSDIEGVSSTSIGEEPNRRVVITSPTARPASRGGNRGGRPGGSPRRSGQGGGSRSSGGRYDDRRRSGPPDRDRDRRRSSGPAQRPQAAPPTDQPPKKTPEATANGDKPLYAKIDLD